MFSPRLVKIPASLSKSGPSAKRQFSTSAQVVKITRPGRAKDVLKIETESLPDLKPNQVLVKMVAVPITPTDLSLIQGYGQGSARVTVAGNEGVGSVVSVGSKVNDLKPNDWVIPATFGLGTWRTFGVFNREHLEQVPNTMDPHYAATLSFTPTTAHRLLEDFVKLESGDVIVQNGANSTVGLSVIQLAKQKGIKTINLIRQRPGFPRQVELLKELGGEMVVSYDYAATPAFRRLIADLPPVKLALNGVGGRAATELARILGVGGTYVTYGATSGKPLTFPSSVFLQKNIQMKGFSLANWLQTHTPQERRAMNEHVLHPIRMKELKLWLEDWPFSKFSEALEAAQQPFRDRKVVISF